MVRQLESERTVTRPKRRAIPVALKCAVCERQDFLCAFCDEATVHWRPRSNTVFDHEPALKLRDVNRRGTDYVPPQHSAEHIDAICRECNVKKTFGKGTVAGSDFGKIKKERKRARALADQRGGYIVPPHYVRGMMQLLRSSDAKRERHQLSMPRGQLIIAKKKPSRWPPKGSRPMRGSRR